MDWDKNQGDISKDLKRTKEKSDVSPRSSGIPFLFPYLFTTLLQQRCGPFFQPGQAVLSEKSEVDAFTVGDLERSADRSSPVQRDDIVDFGTGNNTGGRKIRPGVEAHRRPIRSLPSIRAGRSLPGFPPVPWRRRGDPSRRSRNGAETGSPLFRSSRPRWRPRR